MIAAAVDIRRYLHVNVDTKYPNILIYIDKIMLARFMYR